MSLKQELQPAQKKMYDIFLCRKNQRSFDKITHQILRNISRSRTITMMNSVLLSLESIETFAYFLFAKIQSIIPLIFTCIFSDFV